MNKYDDEQCIKCGVWFGVPAGYQANRRRDKGSFYCPNGHSMVYRESDADVMRRERDIARQQLARAEQEAADARMAQAKAEREAKKLKKRASAGTCPCCQRTFSNMATHMKRQHPEFVAEGGATVIPMRGMAKK